MNNDYISRDAALNVVGAIIKVITPIEESRDIFFHDSGRNAAITGAMIELKKLPSADVAPVVHGRWIDELYNWHCDQCDKWLRIEDGTAHMNYCPNCGAKMDVEIE